MYAGFQQHRDAARIITARPFMPTSSDKCGLSDQSERSRQIAASEAQVTEVRQRREAGAILRHIVEDTGLSMGTIRECL